MATKSCCTYNGSRWNADNESNDGNVSIDIGTVHVSLQKPRHSLERIFEEQRTKIALLQLLSNM